MIEGIEVDLGEEIIETEMIIVGEIIIKIEEREGIEGIEEIEETLKEKEAEALIDTEAKVVAEVTKKEEDIEKALQIQVIVD